MYPHIQVTGEACPMWVPLVENNEFNSPGADYFVKKHIDHISVSYTHLDVYKRQDYDLFYLFRNL